MKREPIWTSIVRPPLLVIGFTLRMLYAGLFGWWLDRLLSRRDDKRLADDVRYNVPFLFGEKRGRIVPSEIRLPRSFDLAVITVSTEDCLIRFSRARGELNVRVASVKPPPNWEELSNVLRNAEFQESNSSSGVLTSRPSSAYVSLADVDDLLRTRWAALQNYWIKW